MRRPPADLRAFSTCRPLFPLGLWHSSFLSLTNPSLVFASSCSTRLISLPLCSGYCICTAACFSSSPRCLFLSLFSHNGTDGLAGNSFGFHPLPIPPTFTGRPSNLSISLAGASSLNLDINPVTHQQNTHTHTHPVYTSASFTNGAV